MNPQKGIVQVGGKCAFLVKVILYGAWNLIGDSFRHGPELGFEAGPTKVAFEFAENPALRRSAKKL
jgi:hypothetical protein